MGLKIQKIVQNSFQNHIFCTNGSPSELRTRETTVVLQRIATRIVTNYTSVTLTSNFAGLAGWLGWAGPAWAGWPGWAGWALLTSPGAPGAPPRGRARPRARPGRLPRAGAGHPTVVTRNGALLLNSPKTGSTVVTTATDTTVVAIYCCNRSAAATRGHLLL